MFKIERPGIYLDVPAADYHADCCPAPSFTQSIAKVLLEKSPAHARLAHPRLAPPVAADDEEPEKYVSAQAIGDAAHALLIGRGKTLAVADFDSWRGKEPQKFKGDAVAAGKLPILTKHMARAYAMVEAARRQMDDAEFALAFHPPAGNGEVVLAWREDDIWMRTMIDWLGDQGRMIYDYKSTGLSCAPHTVEDRPSVMGWDIQAAMHERGLDALDPGKGGRRKHLYINQENEPPYALTVIRISEADLTMGRKKLAMAADIWAACMISGEWPMYPAETVMSRPRGYLETKWLERELAYEEWKQHPAYREVVDKVRKARDPQPDDLIMGG